MAGNKTKPTDVDVDVFLAGITEKRQGEARILIDIMRQISKEDPVMWGPSIIGFGSMHYEYDTGRVGDMPRLGFSPRKSAITVYFGGGFERYSTLIDRLGKHKSSVSCLYINKLEDIDIEILREMIERSHTYWSKPLKKPTSVDEYIVSVPRAAKEQFARLRDIVSRELPKTQEVLSYGIVGYKIDDKRARVYVSGWKDHVAMYPVPRDNALQVELVKYIKGKGTLWFSLDEELPEDLIRKVVKELVK